MRRKLAAAVLILVLGMVVVFVHLAHGLPFNPIRPAPDQNGRSGMERSPSGGCPFESDPFAELAAPDNAASGGLLGPPLVFTVLYGQLGKKIQERSLAVHLSLYDFESGSQIKINADKTFNPFSMIKTLLLLTALEQVKQGGVSLEDTHVLAGNDQFVGETRVAGAGLLQFAAEGTVYTLEELLSLMVGFSDNVATNILFDRIGPKSMGIVAGKLGLEQTAFTRKMYDHRSSLPFNRATAFELTRLLVALENGEVAGSELSRKGIRMMLETGDKRIGLYLDRCAGVANKVGTDYAMIGDMALLYFSERRPLALTIAVENPPDQDEAVIFIGELAALIVEQLLMQK